MGFTPDVQLFTEGVRRNSKDVPVDVPTHDTASRDLAFIVSTAGAAGPRKDVAHTHGSVFATRVQAEHWLDVGRGDAVWCTSEATSPLTMWNTVIGPWSRGAEVVLHHGEFDADERLDLLFRLGPSILCQSPTEYRILAEHPKLERFRSPRLRRLVSTGDFLDPEVVAVFEERWGMTVYDGYGQAETNIIVADLADGAAKPGTFGRALPGHHVAIIDDQGNELPAGIEGDLAVRGRPPTLFAGYWEQPEETKSAFLGDWYLTGDVAHVDDEGFFTFVGRAEDVIASSGRTFGPFDVERVLTGHPAIATSAIVGIRDLQRGGHFIRAFVVPKAGAAGSEQLEAELRQYVAETLPNQQVPREIVFVDELPTIGWKVSRHELRERPLGGRPLWEMPPTTELDAPPVAAAAPPVAPTAAQPVAPPAAPPVAPATPVPDEQVAETTWELVFHEPEPEPPVVAEAVPQPEPAPAPPVQPEPEPAPPPAMEAAPLPEPEPIAEQEPTPVAEVVPVFEPEPVAEVAPAFEPEPVAEVAPVFEAEPVVEVAPVFEPEPVTEPEIVADVVEAEPVVEAPRVVDVARAAEPDPVPEPEPVAEAAPVDEPELAELEPVAEIYPVAEPEPQPEREEAEPPALVALPEPEYEHEPEPAHTPEFSVLADHETLPEYVVETSDVPTPVVVPQPEPEPEPGPLPDFVVESEQAPEPPSVRLEPEEEEEEDLGPLPDYVIDPSIPPELRRPAPEPPKLVPPPPPPEVTPIPPADNTLSSAAGVYFPPTTAFPIPRDDNSDSEDAGDGKRPSRRRPPAQAGKSKRSTQPAEPGDEATEVSWMAGLSNRLSAYSLSDEEAGDTTEDPADDAQDPTAES